MPIGRTDDDHGTAGRVAGWGALRTGTAPRASMTAVAITEKPLAFFVSDTIIKASSWGAGMTETPRRGRPTTGRALTPARRMQSLRQRALTAVMEGADLAAIPDTGLLEALRVAYRQGQAPMVATITRELVRRVEQRVDGAGGPARG